MIPMVMTTVDPVTGELTKWGEFVELLKSPMTVITGIMVWLVWQMGTNMMATQKDIYAEVIKQGTAQQVQGEQNRRIIQLLETGNSLQRKTCIAVSKTNQGACGEDK